MKKILLIFTSTFPRSSISIWTRNHYEYIMWSKIKQSLSQLQSTLNSYTQIFIIGTSNTASSIQQITINAIHHKTIIQWWQESYNLYIPPHIYPNSLQIIQSTASFCNYIAYHIKTQAKSTTKISLLRINLQDINKLWQRLTYMIENDE